MEHYSNKNLSYLALWKSGMLYQNMLILKLGKHFFGFDAIPSKKLSFTWLTLFKKLVLLNYFPHAKHSAYKSFSMLLLDLLPNSYVILLIIDFPFVLWSACKLCITFAVYL